MTAKIMTTEQMDDRIHAVSALLAKAAPGLDIRVEEMDIPGFQSTAYVWVGKLSVCITEDDDKVACFACDDVCVPYRAHASADGALRELMRIRTRQGGDIRATLTDTEALDVLQALRTTAPGTIPTLDVVRAATALAPCMAADQLWEEVFHRRSVDAHGLLPSGRRCPHA